MNLELAFSGAKKTSSNRARPALRAVALGFAASLAACGGGGDGGAAAPVAPVAATTAFDGNVTFQANLAGVTSLAHANGTAATVRADMLLPPSAVRESFVAIVQNVYSVFDLAAAPALRVQSQTFRQADPANPLALATGAVPYASDATLGQLNTTHTSGPDGSRVSLFVSLDSLDTLGTLTTALYCGTCSTYSFGIAVPQSATANPNGYSFQTFGVWAQPFVLPGNQQPQIDGDVVENWFSVGIPSMPAAIPLAGTATYGGHAGGRFVAADTRDTSDLAATVSATVDFATRMVTLSTSASSSLSDNAATGTARSANAGLNLTGTLSYIAGSNTFSGAMASGNGMRGSATCRFYGAGIGAATANKVIASPPEIGCTFAGFGAAVGAIYGSLGAK